MPRIVKEKIIGNLDLYTDRMSVRRIHSDFKKLIGDPQMNCRILKILQDSEGAVELGFRQDDENLESRRREMKRNVDKSVDDLIISDFEAQVSNPNLSVNLFILQVSPELASRIQKVLRKVKLHVGAFSYTGKTSDALRILSHLNPESLKKLSISVSDYSDFEDMNLGVETWNLESLTFGDLPEGKFPIEKWWNVPNTEMTIRHTGLEDLKRLFQHFRTSESFSSCLLMTNYVLEEILRIFGMINWKKIDEAFYYHFEADKKLLSVSVYVYDNVLRFARTK